MATTIKLAQSYAIQGKTQDINGSQQAHADMDFAL